MASRSLDGIRRPRPNPPALVEMVAVALATDLAHGRLDAASWERRLNVLHAMRGGLFRDELVVEIRGMALAILEGRHAR